MISEMIIAAMFVVNYGYVESDTNPLTIIGGSDTDIQTYKFLVSVQLDYTYCGGSIISPTLVITAAHCVHRARRANRCYVLVRIGSSRPALGPAAYIEDIFEHPDYNHTTKVNDISLLLLRSELTYNTSIGAIHLPEENDMMFWPKTVIRAIGFGQSINTEGATIYEYTHVLKEGNLYIERNIECKNAFGITLDSQICARTQNISLTYRDEGSPVLYGNLLIGIVSFSEEIRHPGGLTVLVRVSSYLPFIRQKMNNTK